MKNPEENGFVNRHGRRTGIEAVDLSDTAVEKSTPIKKPKQARASNPTRPRRARRLTKRTFIVLLAILFIIVLVPIAIGELLRAQYLSSADQARVALKNLIKTEVLPEQKSASLTAKQLGVTLTKLEAIRDGMCPGALLDNMASLYPRAHDAHTGCISQRGQIAGLGTQLGVLQKELSYAEGVDAALVQVTSPMIDQYAIISVQQDNWKAANDKIRLLIPPSELGAAHAALVSSLTRITEGWSKLNIANNEQNATDFIAAEKQLSDGYMAVRQSREAFAAGILAKQATITMLADQLAL